MTKSLAERVDSANKIFEDTDRELSLINDLYAEVQRLQGQLDALAKQEPVAWMLATGHGKSVSVGRERPNDFVWKGEFVWKPLVLKPIPPDAGKE